VEIPPAAAARVSATAISAYRAPDRADPSQRHEDSFCDRRTLGTNWLNNSASSFRRGVALFGIYGTAALLALGKVGIFLPRLRFLLLGASIWKRTTLSPLGRTASARWALLFFSTFGIFTLKPCRVLPLTLVRSRSMRPHAVRRVAMARHSLRYRSQLVTGLPFCWAIPQSL